MVGDRSEPSCHLLYSSSVLPHWKISLVNSKLKKKSCLNKDLKSENHVCASWGLQTEFNSEGKALGSILNDNDQPTFMHVAEKAL